MDADKMFEELGYKLDTNFSNSLYLTYKKKREEEYVETIDIDLKNTRFRKTKLDTRGYRICTYIARLELKAINKKCEELGWL